MKVALSKMRIGIYAVLHDQAARDGNGTGDLSLDTRGHGGKLWARADEERGETFQFMLPTGGERIVRVD